jgi:hypothetical protein
MQSTDADITDQLLSCAREKYEHNKTQQQAAVVKSLHALITNPNLTTEQIAQTLLNHVNDPELKDKAMALMEKEAKEQTKKANQIQVVAAMTTVTGDLCICEPRGKPCIRKAEVRFGHMCQQCYRNETRLNKLPEEMQYSEKRRRKQERKRQRAEQAEEKKARMDLAREKRDKVKRVKSMLFAESPVLATAVAPSVAHSAQQYPAQVNMEYESEDASAAAMAVSFVACAVCNKQVEKTGLNACNTCGQYAHPGGCQQLHSNQHAKAILVAQSAADPRLAAQLRRLEPMLIEGPQHEKEDDQEIDILSLNIEDHKEERLQQEEEEIDEENDPDYEEGDDLEAKPMQEGDDEEEDQEEDEDEEQDASGDMDIDGDRPQQPLPRFTPFNFVGGEMCVSCQGHANGANALVCAVCERIVHHSEECLKKHNDVCFDLV